MKNVREMTMVELEQFIKFVHEQTKILNETLCLRGSRKYTIEVFNGCASEVQVEQRKHKIIMSA